VRAAIFKGPHAIEVGERPDPAITAPTDAVVRVVLGCVCGSDLWYYRGETPHAQGSIGHEFIGVVEEVGADVSGIAFRNLGLRGGVAPARTYIPELLDDVVDGRINPGRVFDFETDLDHVADTYKAMDERRAIKALIRMETKEADR